MSPLHAKVAIILGLGTLLSLATYQYVQSYVAEQTHQQIKDHQEQLVDVLVSRSNIPAGDIIDAAALVKRSYPKSMVQDSWLRPSDAEFVIGLAAARYIEKGEPLSPDTIVPLVPQHFSMTLDADVYAVTTMISKPQLHNGLVTVGDRVTLVSANLQHHHDDLLLTDIKVLALDQYDHPSQLSLVNTQYLPSTITFAFTAAQAIVFERMRRQSFSVWLQHPSANYRPIKPIKPITIRYLTAEKDSRHAELF